MWMQTAPIRFDLVVVTKLNCALCLRSEGAVCDRFSLSPGSSGRRFREVLQRRRVFSLFNGVHGLTGDFDLVGQLLLRHLAVLEAQASYFVANRAHQAPRRYWMIWQAERMISAVTRMNSRELVLKMIGGWNAPKKHAIAIPVARPA